MKIIQGAEEFLLKGTNKKGVLVIHGYTGTPAEMRLLGDHRARNNSRRIKRNQVAGLVCCCSRGL